MKKYLLILVFLSIVIFDAHSQIQIRIDSLELRQISITLPKNFSKSDFGSFLDMGPDAIFHLSITNETDTFVPINYNEWIFGYFYSYQGKTFNSEFITFCFGMGMNEPFIRVLMIPGETFPFSLNEPILLGYPIRKNKNADDFDYSKKMLEIIPTIRAYAISPDRQLFISDQPKSIVIKTKSNASTEKDGYKDILNVKRFLKKLSLF